MTAGALHRRLSCLTRARIGLDTGVDIATIGSLAGMTNSLGASTRRNYLALRPASTRHIANAISTNNEQSTLRRKSWSTWVHMGREEPGALKLYPLGVLGMARCLMGFAHDDRRAAISLLDSFFEAKL